MAKRIEPSHRTASSHQENPFFIHYSTSLDSTYFAYQQYLFRLRQQREAKRNKRTKRAVTTIEYSYPGSNAEIQRNESQNLSTWGQINDVRSQLIENHRRTTAAIEATTERATLCISSRRVVCRSCRPYSSMTNKSKSAKKLIHCSSDWSVMFQEFMMVWAI